MVRGAKGNRFVDPDATIANLHSDERVLLIVSSQMTNEINVIERMTIFARNGISETETWRAEQAQLFILARMWGSKMYEAYLALKGIRGRSIFQNEIEPTLDDLTRKALKDLDRDVGRGGLLTAVRDKTFHFLREEEIEVSFKSLPKDEDWITFHSPIMHANFMCWSSEDLFIEFAKNYAKLPTGEKTLEALFEISWQTSINLRYVFRAIHGFLWKRHFADIENLPVKTYPSPPNRHQVSFPFFLNKDPLTPDPTTPEF